MSKPFNFKQFTVAQDRCAMKIGTDGVLLAAWASLDKNPDSILDIGTGTGVIALMLAQRSEAETIDALELDDDAYEQAVSNFEESPWGDRLFCYHAHLYEFVTEIDDRYDLIVCNPPFFNEDQKTPSDVRNQARFEDAMPFELVVASARKLLNEDGIFCIIIPHNRELELIDLAAKAELFPIKITRVKGTPESKEKRSLLSFSFENIETKIDELVIELARHEYTESYINLVKDFYLKM